MRVTNAIAVYSYKCALNSLYTVNFSFKNHTANIYSFWLLDELCTMNTVE